jgi:hypothetical protein
MCMLVLPSVAQDGTASLTGKVQDSSGAGVPGTVAELESEREPKSRFRTVADAGGVFRFAGLPAGEYVLKLSQVGFERLTVKPLHVLDSEQKSLPAVQLGEGAAGDCHVGLDYIQLLPSGYTGGNLSGTVRIAEGQVNSTPISSAAVTLICSTGKVCSKTRTDSDGEFLFKALPRGDFSIRVTVPGFYNGGAPHYRVTEGFESVYSSTYMVRCPLGNCRKKRLFICQ